MLGFVCCGGPLLLLAFLGGPASPPDFSKTTRTRQPLEAKYTALGETRVASQTFPSGQKRFSEYTVWYPDDIASSEARYPIVVFANGSGIVQRKYESVFKHLASWGFVAIGNNDGSSWSGESTLQSLAFLREQNQDPKSVLYQKLDLGRVGVSGHSQGGVGAINAATDAKHGKDFSSVYTASTTKHALAITLKWPYAADKVRAPFFMVAGTGRWDAGDGKPHSGIAPLKSVQENYDRVSLNGLTVMARRRDTDHGAMLYVPNGYMVAWFLHTLKGDADAAKVFTGSDPELAGNAENWEDVKIKRSPPAALKAQDKKPASSNVP